MTTTAMTHRELALPDVRPDEIRLLAGGAGWMGTFALTASFLVNDILSDGEPIQARLVFETDMSRHPEMTCEYYRTHEDFVRATNARGADFEPVST